MHSQQCGFVPRPQDAAAHPFFVKVAEEGEEEKEKNTRRWTRGASSVQGGSMELRYWWQRSAGATFLTAMMLYYVSHQQSVC